MESQRTSVARHAVAPRRALSSGTAISAAPTASQDSRTAPSADGGAAQGSGCWFTALALALFLLLGGLGTVVSSVFLGSGGGGGGGEDGGDELTHAQQMSFYLFWGSAVSLAAGAAVAQDFSLHVGTRRHPAPVIYYRTLANCGYACAVLASNARPAFSRPGLHWAAAGTLDCAGEAGLAVSAVLMFCAWASEAWFLVLIVDLLASLTNPFADYRFNMRK